jgi:hypothetical protein
MEKAKKKRASPFAAAMAGAPAVVGWCIHCCTREATTRDHVPPRALLKSTTGQRVTVPSCDKCNRGSSRDDEYFRLTLSADIGAHSHPAADDAWETSFRGLQRPRATNFKRAFYETTRYMNVVDDQGAHLGRVLTYQASASRQGRVAARIIRGLYYHHTGRVLPNHHVVAWPFVFLMQRELGERRLHDMGTRMANFARANPASVSADGVLHYWCHAIGPYLGWWLVFFGGMPFLGLAFPKRRGSELPSWVRAFEFPTL